MSQNDPDTRHPTGAEGDASNDTSVPFEPRKDDDSPLGDTDQHSKVGAPKKVPAEDGARRTENLAND